MKTDALIKKIQADFPVLPIADIKGTSGEAEFFFKSKKWTDLSAETYARDGAVYGCWDAFLIYLSHQAFAYYLPGHLTMCLRDDPVKLRLIPQFLIMQLEASAKPSANNSHQFERGMYLREHLTLSQKQDVALYLQHQLHHYGSQFTTMDAEEALARKSLDSYWYQFLPEDKPAPPSPTLKR